MTSERWQQVERIFTIAKDCEGASRASLLARECGQDTDLRREVEELLDAASFPGQLDRLAMQVAPAIGQLRRETFGWEGRTVGHYQILEPCGSGGMGVIYKALDQRLGRQVALKFLSPHLIVRADAARRLLREARAAAALDHPNICTIHDVGESEHGHPFIAMPLYAGETLEKRLQRGPLRCAEALALIRQLALALEHAHQRGIVHRDIKPANVMVLPDDTLKVLDFGVARNEDTTATDADATPGTLAYMSPEQLEGEATDHRADVWAVGVVLYEMLTGARPFRGDNRAEVRRAILTGDPEPLAARRPDLPADLLPGLDALLQWVLAKSLDARCPSAAALRAALDELSATNGANEAVRVRDERASQPRVDAAGPEPATLENQWPQADDDAERLAHDFSQAGRWDDAVRHGLRAGARAARLNQFADALTIFDRVREWMRHLPDADALADLLFEQERLSQTLGLRRRQHALIEELIALLAPRGPSARLIRVYQRHGDLATRLARFGEAERALETARRLSRELGESTLEGHALRSLGLLRSHQGRHADALQIAEEALAIDRTAGDEPAVADDLATIGAILKSTGEYAWALARLDEAMTIPALREDPARELFVLHTIADVYRTQGDLDAALRSLLRADEIAVANSLLVPRSSHLLTIAQLHLQQGRLDDALRTYRETVALCRQIQHAGGLAQALRALGEVLFVLNRDDEALPCLQEAAAIFAQLEERRAEADMSGRLAIIFERRGSIEAAAAAYERLALLRRALGDAAGELEALDGLARLTRQRHATSPLEALPAYATALDLATAIGDRRQQAALHNTMGILSWQAGHFGDALRHYDEALDRVRELGDRAHEGLILNSVGVTLHRLGRPDEARTVLEKSVSVNRSTGERLFEAHALTVLGDIAANDRTEKAADTAIACFERSRMLREALGDEAGARAMRTRLVRLRISQPASPV